MAEQLTAPTTAELISGHRSSGRSFTADGLTSFVRSEGDGEPMVMMHGLPSSSYLYRKVIPALAARGFKALSFDLPGLGFADRPTDFDDTFAGLGAFASAAADALGLDRFHLVVHGVGGPVGFEMIQAAPERIKTLTLLNTVVAMDDTPFAMEVYARYAAGRGWPAPPPPRACRSLISLTHRSWRGLSSMSRSCRTHRPLPPVRTPPWQARLVACDGVVSWPGPGRSGGEHDRPSQDQA